MIEGKVTTYTSAIDYRTGSAIAHIWTDTGDHVRLNTAGNTPIRVGDRVRIEWHTVKSVNGINTYSEPIARVHVTADQVTVTIHDKTYNYTIDDPMMDRFSFIQWAKQDAIYRHELA